MTIATSKAKANHKERSVARFVAGSKARSMTAAKTKPWPQLPKTPTGIRGFDEITGGGLPTGRPTLVCGGAGCGKTVFGIAFLVNGATRFDEPGVLMSFQESARELSSNFASFGYDLQDLIRRKKLVIDCACVEPSEIEEAGNYDLEGLFIRLGLAIDSIGAKRVVLDGIESLFAAIPNQSILRAEISRLFRWLKEKGVTAVITGEPGIEMLTRQGLEEYVSDCVIKLDQRITDQVASRRLRVVKYRGSDHGTNEYPFLIDEGGFIVLPITSISLLHDASSQRVSTGVARLDTMLGGKGYYRGSSVLVSGTAGTGKSSLAAHFVDAACRRGERAIYFTFEEPESQIMRNMRSIGIDLQQWVRKGLLQFHATRPSSYGLEKHLLLMERAIESFKPKVMAVDPLNSFLMGSNQVEVKALLLRLVNFIKNKGVTGLFTSLTMGGSPIERTDIAISSLIDTWVLLREIEYGGERNRTLYVLKSRGMPHSNQVREFKLCDRGIELTDVYVGAAGVLTGTARLNQEAIDAAAKLLREQELKRGRDELEGKRRILEAKIAAMRAEFAVQELASAKATDVQEAIEIMVGEQIHHMALARRADITPPPRLSRRDNRSESK